MVQFPDDLLLKRSQFYKWVKAFKEGRERVENRPHNCRPCTSVKQDNIDRVEQLILEDRRSTIKEMAEEVGISVGSIETIIHKHLRYQKVSASFKFAIIPILANPVLYSSVVFIAGLYWGFEKPSNSNKFVEKLHSELSDPYNYRFIIQDIYHNVVIDAICCDNLAKAFLRQTKGIKEVFGLMPMSVFLLAVKDKYKLTKISWILMGMGTGIVTCTP
ncbi:hypothetical protein V9T40_012675 [Parthenolecanium corni]|uniref:Uncharacterized protein n=1 Tax=Parthenolecanium corni TaxID=536013 RepID=A0AAN9TB94_9HEMI